MKIKAPIRIHSEANLREHWAKRARRVKKQRQAAWVSIFETFLFHSLVGGGHLSVLIRLTRIAPRALDDDNLAAAFKAVRDGIADALGVDDADERVRWLYDQRKGDPGEYAIEIDIEDTKK